MLDAFQNGIRVRVARLGGHRTADDHDIPAQRRTDVEAS